MLERILPLKSPALLAWGMIFATLSVMFSGSLAGHMRRASDPRAFNDDSRMFAWLFRGDKGGPPSREDYVARYWLDALPIGYRALYRTWSRVGDPRTLSKLLPYPLLALLLAGAALAALGLGGRAASWGAMVLCLSGVVFLERMAGGHPRAFAFPLIAAMAAALVHGRPYWLAGLTVLAGLFYPAAAFLGGLCLAAWMTLPGLGGAAGLSPRRRLALVAGTALLCAAFAAPTVLALRQYGSQLRTSDMTAYPEMGEGGRNASPDDYPPFAGIARDSARRSWRTLRDSGRPWIPPLSSRARSRPLAVGPLLILMILPGLAWLLFNEPGAKRLLLLPGAMVIAHFLSRTAYPSLYVPPRYVLYVVPLLTAVLLPACASALPMLIRRLRDKPWSRPAFAVGASVLVLALLGGRGPAHEGLSVKLREDHSVYDFISSLPSDSMVAGWPGASSVIDNVPYVCGKTAFITFETHVPIHRGYADEMRGRMRALVDAYFATDPGPLIRLRRMGVTHLIVDSRHYKDRRPWYFKPFEDWPREAYVRALRSGKGLELTRSAGARVFARDTLWVFDLSRVRAGEEAG